MAFADYFGTGGGYIPKARGLGLHDCLRGLFFFCMIGLAGGVAAEEGQPKSDPDNTDGAPLELEEGLEEDTVLLRDIETSSYYELIGWVRDLGLAEAGDRERLQDRLLDHYGLKSRTQSDKTTDEETGEDADEEPGGVEDDKMEDDAPEEDANDEESKEVGKIEKVQLITIESADQAETFQVESVEQDMLRLSGGVVLTIRQEEDGGSHILQAEELIFNRTRDRVLARGGVTYSRQGGGKDETFIAETLSFQVDNWKGFFVEGRSERERTIEGDKLIFHFLGDRIYTAGEDVIILDRGTITSSKTKDPYYRIDARKVWLLGPGEWGILRGVLYIGRIPVFYLPFFYHPGDEMIFNPVIGYRVKDGGYIQTTTYLYGEKEGDESALSFMKIASEQGGGRKKERVGLFLRQTDEPAEESPGGHFKMMADYYSSLGYFGGLSGEWGKLPGADSISLEAGIARSRNIYQSLNEGLYSPYAPGSGDTSVWHDTPLPWGGMSPLRYGFDFSYHYGRFNLSMDYYSDPFFTRDFYDRSETFNWIDYLYRDKPEMTSSESEKNHLRWKAEGRWNIPVAETLRPGIERVSINQFSAGVSWQSEDDTSYDEEDPRRSFFYPEEVEAPRFKMSLSGQLWDKRIRESTANKDQDKGTEEVVPPWEGPGEAAEGETDGEAGETEREKETETPELALKIPDALTLPSGEPQKSLLDFSWTYQMYTQQSWKGLYPETEWDSLDQVDYHPRQGLYTTQNRGSTKLGLNIWDGFLKADEDFSGQGQYRMHHDLTEVEDSDWETKREDDYRFNSASLDSSARMRLFPLKKIKKLDRSYLGYQWGIDYWSYELESVEGQEPVYVSRWFDGEAETTDKHQLTAAIRGSWLGGRQEFSYVADLAPLEEESRFSYDLGASFGIAEGRFYSQFTHTGEEGEEWKYEPLNFQITLQPREQISLEGRLSYHVEDLRFQNARPRLNLGPLFTELFFERRDDFSWAGTQWEVQEEDVFQLQRISTGVNWVPKDPFRFWHRRVSVKPAAESSWFMDAQKVNENALVFEGSLAVEIAEFLRFDLSFISENSSTFRYVPGLSEDVFGVESINPVKDLLRSFDIFDWSGPQARERSHFDLQKIDLALVHHLSDWDLKVEYAAYPKVETREDSTKYYKWIPEFSLLLQWNPIPEIITNIKEREEGLTIETRDTSG